MIQRACIWLSGANRQVLACCPSETTKQVSVGAAVASTAVLAAVAAAVVLGSFLGLPWPTALVAGVLWGLVIGNLDRFLVASSRRQPTRVATFVQFIPRIALAVLVGTVIAEPLVLKLFDTEITQEAVQARQRTAADRRAALDAEFAPLARAEQDRDRLRQGLTGGTTAALQADPRYQQALDDQRSADEALRQADQAVVCEKEATCGSGKVGAGPAYQEKVELRDRRRAERDAAVTRVSMLEAEITARLAAAAEAQRADTAAQLTTIEDDVARLRAAKEQAEARFTEVNDRPLGLLDRTEAASALAASNPAVNLQQWVLRLFIMAVDSLPVLVKMLQSFGRPSLYDEQLDLYEASQLTRARADVDAAGSAARFASEATQTIARLDAEREIADARADARIDAELAAYKAERSRATKQALIDRYLAAWEADQRARLDTDLADRYGPPERRTRQGAEP